MSPVEGLFIILSGAVVVGAELELVSDEVPDGGVLDELLDDEDGGVVGLIDELDDVEPVEGGVVDEDDDVDGDGVTTGGVVDVVLVSRWQPASPNAIPVQSNVTKAALLIVVSRSGLKEGCTHGFSSFDAMNAAITRVIAPGISLNKQCRIHSATRRIAHYDAQFTHVRRANFIVRR